MVLPWSLCGERPDPGSVSRILTVITVMDHDLPGVPDVGPDLLVQDVGFGPGLVQDQVVGVEKIVAQL